MQVRKNTTFWLLTLIFVIPFMAAWLAYAKGFFITGKTTNHGTLVLPPVNISVLALQNDQHQVITTLQGKWWLLYLTDNLNSADSKRTLYYTRQIRQATGKNRDRVARGIIAMNLDDTQLKWLASHYPNTNVFTISPEKIAELEKNTKKLALVKGSLYLVDPLGNIMMSYAQDAAPKGILKDLERVLKVSQIG